MAIEKNNFKVSRIDSEFSPGSRKSMSSDDDELQRRGSAVESDDDEFDDADSGAGSDDFDLLELGETGVEFCQVGNQTCSIPFELYDLQGLEDILSIDVWNECLTEEERFGLTKYLPDMDQETYMLTLKELFTGCSLHFGSPVKKLFDMLKGGLCEPRVALYREGWNFFQKRQHYHLLRKHQNTMVSNLCQIRDAWLNCGGYSIEERLRVLNIMKSQKSLMHEKMEDLVTDSSERESEEGMRNSRIKDRKIVQKMGHHSEYGIGSNLDIRGGSLASESAKYGKQNPKGTLKLSGSKNPAAKELGGRITSVYYGLDMNSGPYSSAVAQPRHSKRTRYESGAVLRMRDQMRSSDDAELYGIGDQHDRISMMEKSGILKVGRKHLPRGDELTSESLRGLPLSSKTDLHSYGRRRDANVLSEAKFYTTKPPNMRAPYDFPKKAKHPDNFQQFAVGDQMKSLKGRLTHQALKGNRVDSSERAESFWNNRGQEEAFSVESPFRSEDWNVRSKKWKAGRESPDLNYKSYRASPQQMNDRFLPSEYRSKQFEDIRAHNGVPDAAAIRGNNLFNKNEETESESSDQLYDDEDSNPLLRSKMAYPTGAAEASRPSLLKPGQGFKKAKLVKKDKKGKTQAIDGTTFSSKQIGGFVDQGHMRSVDNYPSKAKQKGKMRDSPLNESPARVFEDDYSLGVGKFADDDNDRVYNLVKNGQLSEEPGEGLHLPSVKAYPADGKQKKGITRDPSAAHSHHFGDYVADVEDDLPLLPRLLADGKKQGKLRKKGKNTNVSDHFERSEAPLLGCSSSTKKRKGKIDIAETCKGVEDNNLISSHQQDVNNSNSLKRKAKRAVEADTGSSDMETSEPPVSEVGATDMELENKPQKKAFTLITPTVHTGFSFSIIHLLSAVRLAMITPLPEDTLEVGKPADEQNKNEGVMNGVLSCEKVDVEHAGEVNAPSLTVQEIVNRVRSNPGDPCILETQEPLQDLVRGVLKIFSSKTAPLGAKGWKTLAVYEKTSKSWSWLGPVSHSSSDHETIEEVTSPEAWGLPHKMLVKLVDSFANWLKSGQETLQQIGSLPAPPLALMQLNLDEKERFRDLRAQKSLNTISPSSEEVRAYFRKEEVLRYSIPDRAFSYTGADGRKSIVAPLRRCGGKPTSKARDHFMLKRDRPPHVTILCLVRDAAARLPGSIGTRADVCTLIRDSQYIVEDVSDAQVNQVVSGALDRLHYERDPCVQFDGERKLWVYLHREREEEDFEDDGTSSTKKWKRQKKDAAEQADQGAVTVAYHGTADQAGHDLCSDLNAEPSSVDDKGGEFGFDDARQNVDDNVDLNQESEQGDMRESHSMVWEGLDLNPIRENKLLCQENSTNEDFDDETFGRERPVGLLSARSESDTEPLTTSLSLDFLSLPLKKTMPYCEVASQKTSLNSQLNNGIKIFYRTYGCGPTKVLLIIGLAGTHESWGPQIKGLTGSDKPNDADETTTGELCDNEAGCGGDGIEVCAFDNRGMGRSSVPTKKSEYTTRIMAKDAIALLDHLGWTKAHIFGHSMGAMIASKVAAMVPKRVLSLALLNVTGGGFECFPKLNRQTLSIAIRFLKAKTPEERAAVDLDTHYSKEYLEEYVGSTTRRAILYQEYVKAISSTGMQSNHGFEGQLNACWTHKMTRTEIELIRSAGFLVSVIHGRYDVIAQICYARRLAEKLYPVARMVDLPGGHLVSHERTEEINKALIELIEASKMKTDPHEWTNLPNKRSGWMAIRPSHIRTNTEGGSNVSFMSNMLEKLHLCLLYLFGLFVLTFEFAKKTLRKLKPVRVGSSMT